VYYCTECGDKTEKDEANDTPLFCCERPMKRWALEACTKASADPEHARFSDDDEPCDDGRGA